MGKEMIKLRPYQEEIAAKCVHLLKTKGMAYLAMEVRTGKTFTALAACNKLVGHKCGKVVFVTKKKAISSIEADIKAMRPKLQIVVVNYESLHKVNMVNVDVVVLDEAQKLKQYPKPDPKSSLYHKVKAFLSGSPYCKIIFLSGTPSPESYSELYHQFAVSPHYNPFVEYGSFYKWAKDFVNITQIDFGNGPVNCYDDAHKDDVMRVLDPYFLTYTQTQSGFDNQVNEYVLSVEMKPMTYAICDKLKKYRVVEGKDNVILADTPVKLMQKLHQLYSGTVLFEDGEGKVIDDTKAQFITNKFKGKKIAILYKYKLELDLLCSVFPNWTADPEEFKQEGKTFLGQIQSSREGINLSIADALIFFNIDYAALSYFQARDRLTSKDRTKPNNVYWVFAEGGIEERIYEAVKDKKNYTLSYFNRDFGTKSKKVEQTSLKL